mmetsp:Transcript_32104/g.89886  ORF Transcript_32104/g.89886 Transcript_32104/m.89886 type:complete len:555 (+) Transcript_32104:140-1804(+)
MLRSTRERQDGRRRNFKKGIDSSEMRRRRCEMSSILRKNKREEELNMKRRNVFGFGDPAQMTGEDKQLISGAKDHQLNDFIAQIRSDDAPAVLEGTRSVRKILSREDSPPIDEVIASGVLGRLVQLLDSSVPGIQFEAAWALTNIASGTPDQTRQVVDAGAVPAFVKMLATSGDEGNREQAAWAVGNIAGDCPQYRDLVLKCGALEPLLANLMQSTATSFLRNGTWALSNLVRGKPAPQFDTIAPALRVIYHLIHMDDEDMLADACWALSYMTDGEDYRLQAVIDQGIIPGLVELLRHPSPAVSTPALRTVGNIVTGTEKQTQSVVHHGALPHLLNLLLNANARNTKKEVCWALSNITAGTAAQIQAIIQEGFIPHMIDELTNAPFETKKEVAWAMCNLCSGGTPDQIRYLVSKGYLDPVVDLLTCHDPKVIEICLEALEKILTIGESDAESNPNGVNPYAITLENNGGIDALEELQDHSVNKIYEKAQDIIDSFFEGEEEEEETENNNPFSGSSTGFGTQSKAETALFGPVAGQPNNMFAFGTQNSSEGKFVF